VMSCQNGQESPIDDVPEDYIPYTSVQLCSNIILNSKFILEVRGFHPFLIGKALFPYVWLSAPGAPGQGVENWPRVVERSTAKFPSIRIQHFRQAKSLSLSINETRVLQIASYSDDAVVVDQIDLRPLGLLIFGDTAKLTVGTSSYSSNRIEGGRSFLAIG
jgi:hypothetical protein